jgi:hypothetical protein
MHCPRCQHDNGEGRRFCVRCGTGLAAACPQCGFANEPGDEFCGGCGTRLGAPRPPQDAPASPEAYTPRHLAEKILTSRAGDRAADRSANEQAVALYEQALEVAVHLPRTDTTLDTTAALHMLARAPLWLLGRMEAARGAGGPPGVTAVSARG